MSGLYRAKKSISNTFADQQDASGYINYFGVRINDESGNARGVLCAVHSAVVLREIIDAPVLKGAGYSNILDANGNYVLKTIKTFEGDILPDNKEKIAEVIRDTGRGDFILTDRQGVRADAGYPSHHRGGNGTRRVWFLWMCCVPATSRQHGVS